MSQYTFTKSPCSLDSIVSDIQHSSIVTALDLANTNLFGDQLNVCFLADLSTNDQTTLNSVVTANNGLPLPSNTPQPVNIINAPIVTTQYEMNDKDLKLARATGQVDSGTKKAIVSAQVPGTFGSGAGRYVAGGYAISEDYDKDDYVTVRIEDTDRLIAQAVQAAESLSSLPTDAQVQAMGDIPGIGAFPTYPIVKSYTDDEMPAANQGWYFWANAVGNSEPANGECEVEPIGGYGFLPAGFYIVMEYTRATKTTGSLRVNFYWGRKE